MRGDVVHLLAAGGSLEAVDIGRRGKAAVAPRDVREPGSEPVADGRHVYVTAADGRLLAVDAARGRSSGRPRRACGANSGQVVASLPRPVLAGTHVYATAPDGTVFAVDARKPADW